MQEMSPIKTSFLNRLQRLPIIVFVKKYFVAFLVILLFLLSNLFGIWNVKNMDIDLKKGSYIKEEDIYLSLKDVLGSNIFFVPPEDVKKAVTSKQGFVKDVVVEKKIPNTLRLVVKEYVPKYVGYYQSKCVLFSEEGVNIKEICKDCESSCKEESSIYSPVYISSDAILENNMKLIFSSELEGISNVLNEYGYFMSSVDIKSGITSIECDDGHSFVFDITDDLDIQLGRMFLVGQKINNESMDFKSLDLRFERPVMKLK